MNTSLTSSLGDYPNQLRGAMLDAVGGDFSDISGDSAALLCAPIYQSVKTAQLAQELGVSAAALQTVAGESPTGFSELAASTIVGYSIGSGGLDPKDAASAARMSCRTDARNFTQARDAFVSQSQQEFAGQLAGLIALWDLVKPVATGVLGIVDQQQRERAIVAYLRGNGERLKSNIAELRTFAQRKSDYERAAAAHQFDAVLRPALADNLLEEVEKEKVLEAAEVYDTLRSQDPTLAYTDVDKAITRLQNVTSGKYSKEDLTAAISSLGGAIAAFGSVTDNITKLEAGGENNEALKKAVAKIRGKN